MSNDRRNFSHSEYFAARAVEERRMAMSAKDPHVRAIHLNMAERYEQAAQADADLTVQLSEEPRRAG